MNLNKIKEINDFLSITNPKLEVLGFFNNKYKNVNSKVIIQCIDHGLGCTFGNRWNPSYYNLKRGYGCPKCEGSYSPTTNEAIEEINQIISIKTIPLKFIGFVGGKYKNSNSKIIIQCKEHGLGCTFGNRWIPSYYSLKMGSGCPKCEGNYSPTTNEAIEEINQIISIKTTPLKVIGFVGGKYKNNKSTVIIQCKEHGLGCNWANPWNPSYYNLKRSLGCLKCEGTYSPTNNEAIEEINQIISIKNIPLKVIGFVGGKYKNNKSTVIIQCKEHGLGCNWENPWNPSYIHLKRGSGCPKCEGTYSPTTNEAIEKINQIISIKPIPLKVIDFINAEYQGANTQVIIECSKHGLGCNWENPWNPSYDSLKQGSGCPKCEGTYSPITNEAIEEISNIISIKHQNLKVIDFINGKYKNNKSKVIIECKIHGIGCNFKKPWNPSYTNLKLGKGCPQCAIEKQDLTNCLKNVHQFHSNRNIYFVTFKNLKDNKIFHKIGISNENGILIRFKHLKKDNLDIIKADEIITKNIFALLTEYYVLTHFKQYKKSMFHVLKHNKGGSECFNYDLTDILSLKDMIENAINNFDSIISNFDLTEEELINAKKEFLTLKNNIIN